MQQLLKNLGRKCTAALLVVSFVVPSLLIPSVRPVEAQGFCTIENLIADGLTWLGGLVGLEGIDWTDPLDIIGGVVGGGGLYVPVQETGQQLENTTTLVRKECIMDAILWAIKRVIIEMITASVIEWINSGFEGAPTFVQDPQAFFIDMADVMAGEFIFNNPDLQFLCSPFRLDLMINLALAWYQPKEEVFACRLTDVVENIDAFMAGDFAQGGFPGWFRMTMDPTSNPWGSFLEADTKMKARIVGKSGYEMNLLSFAENMFSMRCPDGSGEVCTPGKFISQHLHSTTNSPLAQLEAADEVGEILDALFAYLIREILTGAGGLLGITEADPDTGVSYLDQITEARRQAVEQRKAALIARIDQQIALAQGAGLIQYVAPLNELRAAIAGIDPNDPNAQVKLSQAETVLNRLAAEIRAAAQSGTPVPPPPPPPPPGGGGGGGGAPPPPPPPPIDPGGGGGTTPPPPPPPPAPAGGGGTDTGGGGSTPPPPPPPADGGGTDTGGGGTDTGGGTLPPPPPPAPTAGA